MVETTNQVQIHCKWWLCGGFDGKSSRCLSIITSSHTSKKKYSNISRL
jgi:hypothetical protein